MKMYLCSFLLGLASLAEAANPALSTAAYFPLVAGSVYQYQYQGGARSSSTVTVRSGFAWGNAQNLVQLDWSNACPAGTLCDVVVQDYWQQGPAGITYHGTHRRLTNGLVVESRVTPPMLLLPPSVVPGTPTWVGATLTYPDADMWSMTVTDVNTYFGTQVYNVLHTANTLETVTVPAGTFPNALQVYENNGGYRRNLWFAPGVGLVKAVELQSPYAVQELVSYAIPNAPVPPAAVPAVEYYHASLDHYFVTANPDEIGKLDSGYFQGWARTGYTFQVLAAAAPATAGGSPVCRFYGNPAYGLDSHFYSASPAECAQVKAKFPEQWIFESDNVFQVRVPDPTTGACPVGTVPVYRSWNNRADSNHRYTTNAAVQAQMVAKGYVAEGYGNPPVVMCASSGQ